MPTQVKVGWRSFVSPVTSSYLLDTYAGAAAAYSLRKLRTAYTGAAIRVRRSSDNTELNIGFDASGNLDTTSLLAFVGAGNGFVTTWYDQSGNGYNFTQPTADYQPAIVSSGTLNTMNGKPTILFDGTSDYMTIPSSTNSFSFLHKTGQSFISVVAYNRIASLQVILANNYASSAAIGYSLYTNSASNVIHFTTRGVSGQGTVANTSITAPIPTNSLYLLNNETDNSNATASLRSKLYLNNGSSINLNTLTNTPSTNNASYDLTLGNSGGSPLYGYHDGGISQLIMFNSNQTTNRKGISSNINSYYSIYSTLDTDAQAFITAASITDSTQQSAVNTLVTSLKSAGIWTKMKALYPFVGGTATSHKFNLKDPRDLDAAYRLVFNGGWVHSSTGALPNGTTGYADTKLVPNTDISAINNMHYSVYFRNNFTNTSAAFGIYENGLSTTYLLPKNGSGNFVAVLGNEGISTSFANTSTSGNYIVSRTSITSLKSYKSGTLSNANVTNNGSNRYPNYSFSFGALRNGVSSWSNYFDGEHTFASIGDGLSDTEATAFYNAVQAFQTTLGRQV